MDDVNDNNENPGVVLSQGIAPTDEYYEDMITGGRPEADYEEVMDKYVNVEPILDITLANEWQGRVTKRLRGIDGKVVGSVHVNPFFDTREYDIEFTDGSMDNYTANIIA